MSETEESARTAAPAQPPKVVWRPVLAIAAVAAVAHLAVAARYGWHRDEFYYVICGRHLAWGYVDQPPLTPALARLAARVHVQEGTLARSLLSTAIDEADPDGRQVTDVLDSIPGAWDRAQLGRDQARRGETIPLDDL